MTIRFHPGVGLAVIVEEETEEYVRLSTDFSKRGRSWSFGATAADDYSAAAVHLNGRSYLVGVQNYERLITPEESGLARWVFDNATDIVDRYGPGVLKNPEFTDYLVTEFEKLAGIKEGVTS
jgi:hypothetical protein